MSADSWALGQQHALLCVKQAKAYLDDVLAMGWDGALSRIRESDLVEWFANEGAFAKARADGAGEHSIRAFLGGAFAKGHGVRDALAIMNHREISQIERAGLVAEWVRIVDERKGAQVGHLKTPGAGPGSTGGKSEAARKLGMTRQTVERSLKINGLSDAAKAEAARLDLAGNQKALLKTAEVKEPSAQVQALRDHADYTSPTGQKGVSKVYKRLCRD